jgi:hypothetical protein
VEIHAGLGSGIGKGRPRGNQHKKKSGQEEELFAFAIHFVLEVGVLYSDFLQICGLDGAGNGRLLDHRELIET